jgi:hypothetical protein
VSDQLHPFDRVDGDLNRTARCIMRWLRLETPCGLAIPPRHRSARGSSAVREDLLAAVAVLEDLGLVTVTTYVVGDNDTPTVSVHLADDSPWQLTYPGRA